MGGGVAWSGEEVSGVGRGVSGAVPWAGVEWGGVYWSGVGWSRKGFGGVEWNRVEWNEERWSVVDWSGMAWGGVEWSGVERRGVAWGEVKIMSSNDIMSHAHSHLPSHIIRNIFDRGAYANRK